MRPSTAVLYSLSLFALMSSQGFKAAFLISDSFSKPPAPHMPPLLSKDMAFPRNRSCMDRINVVFSVGRSESQRMEREDDGFCAFLVAC